MPDDATKFAPFRSLAIVSLFWISLTAIMWLLARESVQGKIGARDRLMSFDFNPTLFMISVCVVAVTLASVIVGLIRLKSPNRIWITLSLPVLILGVGGVLASLSPAQTVFVGIDYVPVQPDRYKKNYVVPIFFDTGSDALTATEQRKIDDILLAFKPCTGNALQVFGFASSKPFKPEGQCDSNCLNKRLAQRRGASVSKYINSKAGYRASHREWDAYEEMSSFRRLVDRKANGVIDPIFERLNRRVELTWDGGACRISA